MTRKTIGLLIGASVLALVIAACGTAATPEWAAAAQGTRVAIASTSEHETAIAPTHTPTPAPTETPTTIPPTATTAATSTPLPPTATVPPTVTTAPTQAPTTAPTAQPAGGDVASQIAAAQSAGNADNGKAIFNEVQAQAGFACATCHSVDEAQTRIIGPGLYGLVDRAGSRVPGESAIDYIHQSIVDPSAYVVPDFPDNLMPHVFGQIFSDQQIKDIIAYLVTLHK